MAISGPTREIFKDGIASGPVAKEICDAIDAATNQATNATPTNITATNVSINSALNMAANGTVTMGTNTNIAVSATGGTRFATNATQLISLYGVTPVVQPAGTGELLGLNGNAATAANATNMNSNGNLGTKYYGINDIVKALKQLGGLAVS